MSGTPFADLTAWALCILRQANWRRRRYILLYAYNGTGKTACPRPSRTSGNIGETGDTLYFNAFTEDLFSWDNDLENDRERVLKINAIPASSPVRRVGNG